MPAIGNAIGIPFRKGGTSWSSYCTPLTISVAQITGGLRISWTSQCTNEDGFEIWVSIDGAAYVLVDIVLTGVLTYDDTTDYGISSVIYRVRAYRGTAYSEFVESAEIENIDSDLATYISGLATPLSDDQLLRLNTFVSSLKTGLSIDNLSEYFDVMYLLAGETEESSLRNLVANANHCTKQGSPVYAQYEGFTGATNGYLDTGYNPSTEGLRFTQNNASYGIYCRTNADTINVAMGNYDATTYTFMRVRYSNVINGHLNGDAAGYSNVAETDSRGLTIIGRNGASHLNMMCYKNKTASSTTAGGTGSTAGLVNNNMYILCRNGNGTAGAFDTSHQFSFAFAGKFPTTGERDVIVDAIEAYMDANGKGVIA